MHGYESEHMPLRILDQFYDPPIKTKSGQGIKVFPSLNSHTRNILTPKGDLPSIRIIILTQLVMYQALRQ